MDRLPLRPPPSPASSSPSSGRVRLYLALAFLGFVARFALAGASWGTSDMLNFVRFAFGIDRDGLLATYRADAELNHPPLAAYWTWLALRLSNRSPQVFAFVFRVPVMLADVGTAWLLWAIWRDRRGSARAAGVVAAYAWCPIAILISAYHGNTDSIYAFLCLLAVRLAHDGGRPFWGGLALAAAVNVKLIPILLIPTMLLGFRQRYEAYRFLTGLAAGALPFLPPLIFANDAFRRNVLAYQPHLNLWGVNLLLLLLAGRTEPKVTADLPGTVIAYMGAGRYLILAAATVWAVAARWWARCTAYDAAAAVLTLFVVLSPGFGMQYLVVVVPLLFATRPVLASAYGAFAGLFAGAAYVFFWDGTVPISSVYYRLLPPAVAAFGLPAWAVLVYYLFAVARRRARGSVGDGSRAAKERPAPASE